MTKKKSPVLLIILDGWGVGDELPTNAVFSAHTPNMDSWTARYPFTTLSAHNGAVGLPEGQMGNSEVGHLNIGAGRVVYQDFTRINRVVDTGELSQNEVLVTLIDQTIAEDKALHLMGLVSDGGVHSHIKHLYALIEAAVSRGLAKIYIHCFMDGRDTPPQSGLNYIKELQARLATIGSGEIASICGRFYAMDRDNRWQRVSKAWEALVDGQGASCNDPVTAIRDAYAREETDEFIKPTVIRTAQNEPVGPIQDGDSVLFFNFRADRARELTHAFTDVEFDKFTRKTRPPLGQFVTCTSYERDFDLPILFPPLSLGRILGEEVSTHKLRQLRIAETEKYAHVTYFFNGGRESPFPGEDRVLIESPRDVATYDLKPQMSAPEVTDQLQQRLAEDKYNFMVLNFANGDMVGHSGKLKAAIEACEAVDLCLEKLVEQVLNLDGVVLITADHGNADIMLDIKNKCPHTAHTLNPVPFLLISDRYLGRQLKSGGALKDIAPTVLNLLGLPVPTEMEGENLLI